MKRLSRQLKLWSTPPPSLKAARPELKALLATPPELKPTAEKAVFARRDGILLYAAPHTAAPKLAELKAGARYAVKAVTVQEGRQWLAFQFTADGPPAAFGKAEDFQ